MELSEDKRPLFEYLLIIISLVVVMVIIDVVGVWGDVDYYWKSINSVYVDHRMPYSDVKFEYPPLAILVFLIPRVFSWDLQSFRVMFGIFTIIAYVVALYFSYKIGEHFNIRREFITLIFLATAWSMYMFIIARYDIFPIALSLVAIYLYLERKHELAFVVIALAAMVKLYPVLIALCFMIPYLRQHRWTALVKGLLICAAVALLSELPFMIDNLSTAFSYLTYHSDRGIQVESVVATFIQFWYYVDPSCCYVVHNYGSDNLAGPLPDMIAPVMNYILLAAVLVFVLLALYAVRRIEPSDDDNMNRFVVLSSTIIVFVFIVFNKVYSAQYWMWFVLMIPCCLCLSRGERGDSMLVKLTVIGCFTSFLASFSYFMVGMYSVSENLQIFQAIKNVFTVVLMVIISTMLFRDLCGIEMPVGKSRARKEKI